MKVCHSVCNISQYVYILYPGKILSRTSYICIYFRLIIENRIELECSNEGKQFGIENNQNRYINIKFID